MFVLTTTEFSILKYNTMRYAILIFFLNYSINKQKKLLYALLIYLLKP